MAKLTPPFVYELPGNDSTPTTTIHMYQFLNKTASQLIEGSSGVQGEMQIAQRLEKPIEMFHYHGEDFN